MPVGHNKPPVDPLREFPQAAPELFTEDNQLLVVIKCAPKLLVRRAPGRMLWMNDVDPSFSLSAAHRIRFLADCREMGCGFSPIDSRPELMYIKLKHISKNLPPNDFNYGDPHEATLDQRVLAMDIHNTCSLSNRVMECAA